MKNTAFAVAAMIALAACDGVGGGDGNGTGGTPPGTPPPVNNVPAEIAGDLRAANFSAPSSLTVQITLDSGVVNAVYDRNDTYIVPGYIAFTRQDDPLDRFFTAFAAQSADGSVQAVVVADGGQFTKFFGGATYRQTSAYTAPPAGPTTGLVSYAGTYAGLLNISTRNGTLAAPGANGDLLPERSSRVTGDVFLNASFADNSVNGAIYNRQLLDRTGFTLDTVFLIPTNIAANGAFSGTTENRLQESIGSYAGTFGGNGATSVAGAIHLTGEFVPEADNEDEYGIFVLSRCGTTGAGSICGIVN